MNARLIGLGVVAAITLGGVHSAGAAWTAKSGATAVGAAKALSLPQVTGVAAADGAGSSSIAWDAASFGPGVTGYRVQRYTANAPSTSGQTAVCTGALTSTATSCTDTVAAGTYFYSVLALYKPTSDTTVNWSGAESTRDSAVVTAAAATTYKLSMTATSATQGTNNWRATVNMTLVDNLGAPLNGYTITGAFSSPTGAVSCPTSAAGTCSISSGNIANTTTSSTFTVSSVTKTGNTLTPAANTQTTVVANKP